MTAFWHTAEEKQGAVNTINSLHANAKRSSQAEAGPQGPRLDRGQDIVDDLTAVSGIAVEPKLPRQPAAASADQPQPNVVAEPLAKDRPHMADPVDQTEFDGPHFLDRQTYLQSNTPAFGQPHPSNRYRATTLELQAPLVVFADSRTMFRTASASL